MKRGSRRNIKVKDVVFTEVSLSNTALMKVTFTRSMRVDEDRNSIITMQLEACTARELVVQLKKAFTQRQRITTQDLQTINEAAQ